MGSFVPRTVNQDIIAVSAPPRNMTLNEGVGNFPIDTSQVIYLIKSLPPFPQRMLP